MLREACPDAHLCGSRSAGEAGLLVQIRQKSRGSQKPVKSLPQYCKQLAQTVEQLPGERMQYRQRPFWDCGECTDRGSEFEDLRAAATVEAASSGSRTENAA